MNNRELQQKFLDEIKQFVVSNPNSDAINTRFIYSRLMFFGVTLEQGTNMPLKQFNYEWQKRYENNYNIDVYRSGNRNFIYFSNGKLKGNEIKMYIPLDYDHINEGAKQLFDFISSSNIAHQSKISDILRNDNLVVRVNSLEDAETIVNFVNSNSYMKEGLIKVNPFLASYNGIGFAMDNNESYNYTLCEIINNYINYLKSINKIELLTVENLNQYIHSIIPMIEDLDLKDIYSLIEQTTKPDFQFNDFLDHANDKLSDEYNYKRERITDPSYYLEKAIKVTQMYYPNNCEIALEQYLKGNANYFTNKERARDGLIKYVHPGNLINIMREKVRYRGMQIPNSDEMLIQTYLYIIFNVDKKSTMHYEIGDSKKTKSNNELEIVKSAYINTARVYSIHQARAAMKELLINKNLACFTDQFSDRTNLKSLMLSCDIKRLILENINLENLDVNNIYEIISRFEDSIGMNISNTKIY